MTKPQRITEQDALAILEARDENPVTVYDKWLPDLLAKLNEHREPDCKLEDLHHAETALKCAEFEKEQYKAQRDELLNHIKNSRSLLSGDLNSIDSILKALGEAIGQPSTEIKDPIKELNSIEGFAEKYFNSASTK